MNTALHRPPPQSEILPLVPGKVALAGSWLKASISKTSARVAPTTSADALQITATFVMRFLPILIESKSHRASRGRSGLESTVRSRPHAGKMRGGDGKFDLREKIFELPVVVTGMSAGGGPYRAACMFSATACIVLPYSPAELNSTTSPPSSTTRLCPGSR